MKTSRYLLAFTAIALVLGGCTLQPDPPWNRHVSVPNAPFADLPAGFGG